MASPHHIQCPSCKRTHGPPTGAMCRSTKAAKEHCAQLGMGEEDYMLYLSDISQEDPYETTGGQLARLFPDAPSNPVQEKRRQSDKNVTHPGRNQDVHQDVHQVSSHLANIKDINHRHLQRHSDQNKRKEFKSKAGDEGYESFMSNAPTTITSGGPLSSTEFKSPHAQGGHMADISEHEAVDTEQHISGHGAQTCISVDQEGEIYPVAAQDMQIREADGQESHRLDTPESECEISKVITQDTDCAGDQEEVVTTSIAEESTTISGRGDFDVGDVPRVHSSGHGQQQVQGLVKDTHVRQMDESEPQVTLIDSQRNKHERELLITVNNRTNVQPIYENIVSRLFIRC